MRNCLSLIILLLISPIILPESLSAQNFIEDFTEIFEFRLHSRDPNRDPNHYPTKMIIAPVITFEPSTSLGIGIGSKFLFKFKKSGPETRTSNIPLSVLYTLNNQFIFTSGYHVFFNQEKWLLKGNLGYSKFPVTYFGIGNLTRDEDHVEIAFDNVLIEPLLLKRISPGVFLGGGIRYNVISRARLQEGENGQPAGLSLQDSLGSTSLGLEVALTVDSRNNVLNASEGVFLEFTHGFYDDILGGTNEFMLTKMNFRQYFKLWDRRDDILAFEFFTRFSWNDTPTLELSSLGGAELLRGFQEGRYRDRHTIYTQLEYRWQTWERIGFVFFGGMGDVLNNLELVNLRNLKYNAGIGLRLKIVKSENLNIRFDYGFGLGPSRDNNFYLGIAEAF